MATAERLSPRTNNALPEIPEGWGRCIRILPIQAVAMITVYLDGLAEPNPGVGTYGYAIYRDGKDLKKGHGFDGDPVSNNHAEYAGLIEALKSVAEFEDEAIVVKSDSKLLVHQMSGDWKVSKRARKNQSEWSYVEMFSRAKELAERFRRLRFEWIPREENTEADALSRVAYHEHLAERRERRHGASIG